MLSTGKPFNLVIFAVKLSPLVPSLLKTSVSPTLYSLPEVIIPILDICPGVAALTLAVCSSLFGMYKYGYSESSSIRL